ncbi:hypothetical protein CONPUDRAFT_66042, partial [Coniophora puteana RWD-64-598 SS2]
VQMNLIPNIAFGRVANRHIVRIFFPALYRSGQPAFFPNALLHVFYDKCLRPAVYAVLQPHASYWPTSYKTALEKARTVNGTLVFGSLDVPAHELDALAEALMHNLDNVDRSFAGAYFGHELRGWKSMTMFSDEDVDDVYRGLDRLTDCLRLEDLDTENDWQVDVGIEISSPDHVVTWREDSHSHILSDLLPSLSDERINRIMASRSFHEDPVMQLGRVSGFRADIPFYGRRHNISYIQAYTTEKALSYQLHQGLFRTRSPHLLLNRSNHDKLLSDMMRMGVILLEAAAEDGTSRPQSGSARLEIRVPLANADTRALRMSHARIASSVYRIPATVWW